MKRIPGLTFIFALLSDIEKRFISGSRTKSPGIEAWFSFFEIEELHA
ncbi:MAG: hypothetical protein Q8930_15250 [Bacillota bacterium]|nr:hypothetical protein [Bacillota bacterium]